MAQVNVPEANIPANDGRTVYGTDFTGAGKDTVPTTGYTMTLHSKNEYGEALSEMVDVVWGETKDVIYGGRLAQKILHVSAIVGFYIGNMLGAKAFEDGKETNALGVAF